MKRLVLLLLALGLLGSAACKSGDPVPRGKTTAVPPPAESAGAPQRFGAPLSGAEAMPLGQVLDAPGKFADRVVTVEGQVRRNCTVKGCWMELAEGADKSLQGCRVTFKDYGFFVPLDSAGSRARVQGTVLTKVVPKGEVDHLEAEGATFPSKQPDGTAREVRIIATGVELFRG